MSIIALALASAVATAPAVTDSPDLIYMNTRYALVQEERGISCFGCQSKPVIIKGSDRIKLTDDLLVESASAGVVFVTANATESCPAGQQYIINLADAHMEPLNVPCGAEAYTWTFSENNIVYKYSIGNTEVFKYWNLD